MDLPRNYWPDPWASSPLFIGGDVGGDGDGDYDGSDRGEGWVGGDDDNDYDHNYSQRR